MAAIQIIFGRWNDDKRGPPPKRKGRRIITSPQFLDGMFGLYVYQALIVLVIAILLGVGRFLGMDNKRCCTFIHNIPVNHHFLDITGGWNFEHRFHQDIFHD